jgi:hypothetical protein
VSRRWPGWEDLAGIEVEGGCNAARKQDRDYVVMRVMAGPDGANGPLDMYPVAFHADGHVSVLGNEDFECEITDGMLTSIFYRPDEFRATLVKALFAQVPSGDALPFLHYYVAGEQISSGNYVTPIDAAIDCSAEESGSLSAALQITIARSDSDVTASVWPLTPESAFALLSLMRERHGEPYVEALTDLATWARSHGALGDAIMLGHDTDTG